LLSLQVVTLNRLPPLNSLRAFLAAARHASFVKAGDELGVTPAAISQQVKQLEATLGVDLFERLPRGLTLTEGARAAMPEMEKAFAHLARAVTDLQGASISGPLIVSVIPSFAGRWLVPRLPHFTAAYPDIEPTVRAELRNVDFAREDVDVAIRYGRGIYPGLETRLLLTEDVFPICAPTLLNAQRPLRRLEDLRHHTLLHDRQLSGDEPSLTWRAWLQTNDLPDFDPTRGPGFTDATMMLEAAVRGMGVALGRSALVADDLAAGRLVRPIPIQRPAEYAYYVVAPEGASRQPRVRLFMSWLEEQAAASRSVTEVM
jgi:LysR family glycine cleavage system transcriptional activator